MKLRDIIQRIQSANSKGVNSDDSRLTNRHIYNKLLTVRFFLLSRLLRSKRTISSWNYFVIPCAEVIEVDYSEQCSCIPESGCSLYRTKYPIPKPMMNLSSHMIKSVTNLKNTIIFDPITAVQSKYIKGNKYAKKNSRYFLENGYMYFTSPMELKLVKIVLIPEDIVEAKKFSNYCNNADNTDCISPLDTEFPIDSELLEPMIQMAYEELITGFSQGRPDVDNNSVDTALNPSRLAPKEDPNSQQQQE